jgi:anti-sigma regulatory factor (Ser/Thr protein kinase)
MSEPQALEIELRSNLPELSGVRDRLRRWAGSAGWPESDTADIVLAVDEALTNVIRHGYGGVPDQRICLRAQVIHHAQRGPGIEITIRDFGRQVDPATIVGRDLNDLRPGGLGVHIIRSLMDSAVYSCAEGGGMMLVMTRFQHAGDQEQAAPQASS